MIFHFEVELSYKNLFDIFILLKNLASILVDKEIIDKKFFKDLKNHKVEEVIALTLLLIFSSSSLIFKYDKNSSKIHHLFHIVGRLINDQISDWIEKMRYS